MIFLLIAALPENFSRGCSRSRESSWDQVQIWDSSLPGEAQEAQEGSAREGQRGGGKNKRLGMASMRKINALRKNRDGKKQNIHKHRLQSREQTAPCNYIFAFCSCRSTFTTPHRLSAWTVERYTEIEGEQTHEPCPIPKNRPRGAGYPASRRHGGRHPTAGPLPPWGTLVLSCTQPKDAHHHPCERRPRRCNKHSAQPSNTPRVQDRR